MVVRITSQRKKEQKNQMNNQRQLRIRVCNIKHKGILATTRGNTLFIDRSVYDEPSM